MKRIFRWPILWWLRFWALFALKKSNPFIVGITGSAGKSSAIDAIAPVLKLKFKNLKVAEKANSESGIPADILGLHFGESVHPIFDWLRILALAPIQAIKTINNQQSAISNSFDCYLVEMGIDEPTSPKNMGYLLTILKPDIAVILNVLPVHTEQFERSDLVVRKCLTLIESIAAEKGKLITENQNLQWAILNADQPEINSLKPKSAGARTLTFGKSPAADVKILNVIPSLSQTEVLLSFKQREYQISLKNMILPEFYGFTLSAAFATGICLGQDPQAIAEKISAGFKLPSGRGWIFPGIKNTAIIDSSYNASRETVIGSLKMLQNIGGNKTKIAVLGDMRELGSQAKIEHEKIAEVAVKTADKIVLVGPLMKQYALPIIKQSKLPVEWFLTAGEAAKFLLAGSSRGARSGSARQISIIEKHEFISGGEIILVKGSQNTIFLEIVVETLLENKSDISNLCRRGKFWDKKRLAFQKLQLFK
ncbi:hypothetical protein HYU89_00550 [Candidatus Collierbacteria bacterium]|nr:hypothetical protein [Candidatus Collierbacteria bacterium]